MRTFQLEIELENAALTDEPVSEVTRILQKLCASWALHDGLLGKQEGGGVLRDVNGNNVGRWSIDDAAKGVRT